MGFKKLVGIAAIGGFLYENNRRGGQLNLDSFKRTARGLMDDISGRARELKSRAEEKLQEQRRTGMGEGVQGQQTSGVDDVTGYGSSGYGYGTSDINRR